MKFCAVRYGAQMGLLASVYNSRSTNVKTSRICHAESAFDENTSIPSIRKEKYQCQYS
jgi:hypothetical protein